MKKTICLFLSLLMMLGHINIIVSAEAEYDINDCIIDVYHDVLLYDGSEKTTEVRIIHDDELLTQGEDYTVSYENNTEPGIAAIIISGTGRFSGEVEKPLRIVDKNITPVSSGTCGESLTWAIDENNVLLISGEGEMENYSNPADQPWDSYRKQITGVIVDDGVQSICDLAFSALYSMEYIYIGNTVRSIGLGAFSSNYMKSVCIPDSVEEFGEGAVSDTDIETIHLGNHLNSVNENMFDLTDDLQFVIVPESVKDVKDHAFYGCRSMKAIYFTGDAPEFDGFAFYHVKTTVYYPAGNVTWTANKKNGFRELTWKEWMRGDTVDISEASIYLSGDTVYTGNPICPRVQVILDKYELEPANYNVEFTNNINAGTATVSVTGTGSYSGTAVKTFEISKAGHSIAAESDHVEMNAGETLSLNISNAVGTLSCISVYPQFAHAEASGSTLTISAYSKGYTVLTVKDPGNQNYYDTECKILVTVNGEDAQWQEPKEISLNKRYFETATESVTELVSSIVPEMADQTITWSSSDEKIAAVDNGQVRALRYGKAVITAVSASNPSLCTSCEIQTRYYDVNDTSLYYYKPVYWAADRNITKGYDNVYFGPKNFCTREAVVTFLWRAAGQPYPRNLKSPFKDVQDPSKYYYKAVLWAAENEITKGYSDGTFRPHDTCLREHVVTFLWRYAGKPDPNTGRNPFNDVNASDYYYRASLWANKNGIANGYSSGPYRGGFGPKLDCLREHVVTFLYRYIKEDYILPSVPDENSYYLVVFNTGKDGVTAPPQRVKKGDKVSEPYIRGEHYKIIGWYTDPEYTDYFDFDDDKVTSDLTLYARWFKDDFADVTKYSYEVYPILSPYAYYVYVKTDNPDPESFILNDPDSKYWTQNIMVGAVPKSFYSIYNDSNENITEYSDVVYENLETHRVRGGYIFEAPECLPDGGKLVVQQRVADYTHLYIDSQQSYVDTDIIVNCPELKTAADGLIASYTDQSRSLFENLDAVEDALETISVYPLRIRDSNKPNNDRPYPLLAYSSYDEGGFDEWYSDMYEDGDLLVARAYPYRNSSLGFPGLIEDVAKTLEPECEVTNGEYHYEIEVTYNGVTKTYGGAGGYSRGGIIYTAYADDERKYLFDGSSEDVFSNAGMNDYQNVLIRYNERAYEDSKLYKDLLAGHTFRQITDATGGTWIRTGKEGWNFDNDREFTYVLDGFLLRNIFVDGRYISDRGQIQYGAKFTDHSNAAIVVPDMNYIDKKGIEHTGNVPFYYNSSVDKWIIGNTYYGHDSPNDVPEEYTLTREQIEKMNVDAESDKLPAKCLIYDGTEFPGTSSLTIPHTIDHADKPDYSTIYGDFERLGYQLVAKDAEGKVIHEGIEWTADHTDGIEFFKTGYFVIPSDSKEKYVFTCKPLPGAANVSGEITVEFRQ